MPLKKIDIDQARHDMEASEALLVCAYESEEKFKANHLEGAISLNELRQREDQLSKQRELIFYCN